MGRLKRRLVLLLVSLLLLGCGTQVQPPAPTPSVSESPLLLSDLDVTSGQTIYVPAYSAVYFNTGGRTIELDVTLSIHNTDLEHPIVLTSVRYYDTNGQFVTEYLEQPLSLGPLAATDFFVDAQAQRGGIGTNFIVEWVAEEPVLEPIVEALMLSTASAQGISFSSPGRVISQIAPQGE